MNRSSRFKRKPTQFAQNLLEVCFSAWGKVVTKATIIVFLASAIAIVMLGK